MTKNPIKMHTSTPNIPATDPAMIRPYGSGDGGGVGGGGGCCVGPSGFGSGASGGGNGSPVSSCIVDGLSMVKIDTSDQYITAITLTMTPMSVRSQKFAHYE